MNIEQKIKIKQLKNNLSKKWYKLMSPLAKFLNKRDKIKYEKFQQKAYSMSLDEVANRTCKIIIKKLIDYNQYKNKNKNIYLEIASYCDRDYYIETILQFQCRQRDKKLSTYAYNVKDSLNYNKEISKLIENKLIEKGCKVEYIFNKDISYNFISRDYIQTMIISLN